MVLPVLNPQDTRLNVDPAHLGPSHHGQIIAPVADIFKTQSVSNAASCTSTNDRIIMKSSNIFKKEYLSSLLTAQISGKDISIVFADGDCHEGLMYINEVTIYTN